MSAAPSVRGSVGGPGPQSFSAPNRAYSHGNRQAGNNWNGNWNGNWQGHHHHGRHFRGVYPFFGAYAYTYPYYDDDDYGYGDRCAYVDHRSWWWRRYCAPYYR